MKKTTPRKITFTNNYKTTLCSNRACKAEHPTEKCTFVAPNEWVETQRKGTAIKMRTAILRFCSIECKCEWLKKEYNRNR